MTKTLPWILGAAVVAAIVWFFKSQQPARARGTVQLNTGSATSLLNDIFGTKLRSNQIAAANVPSSRDDLGGLIGAGASAISSIASLFKSSTHSAVAVPTVQGPSQSWNDWMDPSASWDWQSPSSNSDWQSPSVSSDWENPAYGGEFYSNTDYVPYGN